MFCIGKFFAEIPETAAQRETLLLAFSADIKPSDLMSLILRPDVWGRGVVSRSEGARRLKGAI